jgi:hypothetical protein
MSETAAIRKFFISPAGLFIFMSYLVTTGIIALIKPPAMNRDDITTVIIKDHLRKSMIFPLLIIPGILNPDETISEIRKRKNPYSMKASQNPPMIFRISVITDECLDSRNLEAMKIAASRKKVSEYISLFSCRTGNAL